MPQFIGGDVQRLTAGSNFRFGQQADIANLENLCMLGRSQAFQYVGMVG